MNFHKEIEVLELEQQDIWSFSKCISKNFISLEKLRVLNLRNTFVRSDFQYILLSRMKTLQKLTLSDYRKIQLKQVQVVQSGLYDCSII